MTFMKRDLGQPASQHLLVCQQELHTQEAESEVSKELSVSCYLIGSVHANAEYIGVYMTGLFEGALIPRFTEATESHRAHQLFGVPISAKTLFPAS